MFSSTSSPPGPASMLSLSSNKSSRELLFLVSQTVKHRQKTHKPRTANSTRALHIYIYHIYIYPFSSSHWVISLGADKWRMWLLHKSQGRSSLVTDHWPIHLGREKKLTNTMVKQREWKTTKTCGGQQFRNFFWTHCCWPKHFKAWRWIPQQSIFGQDLFHPNCFREVVEKQPDRKRSLTPPAPYGQLFVIFFCVRLP